MLEFEVTGDRKNFFDLQKIFLEVKCKIFQSSEADSIYETGAATDVTKTDAPIFAIMCYIHSSLTVQCLLMEYKFQMLTETMLIKNLLKQNFHITKMQKTPGWHVRATPTKKIRERCQLEK